MAQQEKNKKLILASASPRRREILEKLGYSFEIIPSRADESLPLGISPREAAEMLAVKKAMSIPLPENSAALGSDTVVAFGNEILGKPENEEDAFRMLRLLSGKKHSVFTGAALADESGCKSFVSETAVEFYPLSDETIENYIATHEPMDKAGAYGIQGAGSLLVKKIEGDFFAVMGLPAAETARLLSESGIKSSLGVI